MRSQADRSNRRRLLWYFVAALAIPGISIVLHESGHYAAHAAFGYEVNDLSYDGVSVGSPPAGVDPRIADGVSFAAGTLVSIGLLGVAMLSMLLRGPNPLGIGFAVFECIRALFTLVGGISQDWQRLFIGGVGELRYLSVAIGDARVLATGLWWLEFLLPFAVLLLCLRQFEPRRRLLVVTIATVASLAGLALWLLLIGPWLLP